MRDPEIPDETHRPRLRLAHHNPVRFPRPNLLDLRYYLENSRDPHPCLPDENEWMRQE